jgi:hypothetical protein
LNPDQTPAELKAESLVPPRPNLGPEPWPEALSGRGTAVWLGLSVGFVLLMVGLGVWKQRRSRLIRKTASTSIHLENEAERSPRERLIATSEQVRGALIRTFGAPWGSKTTEEIGRALALIERLDPTEVDRLIAFLKLADRAKFAEGEPELVEDWEAWSTAIVAHLASPPSSKPAR